MQQQQKCNYKSTTALNTGSNVLRNIPARPQCSFSDQYGQSGIYSPAERSASHSRRSSYASTRSRSPSISDDVLSPLPLVRRKGGTAVSSNSAAPLRSSALAVLDRSLAKIDSLGKETDRVNEKKKRRNRRGSPNKNFHRSSTRELEAAHLNLLNVKSIELFPTHAGKLSARGLHSRTHEVFWKEVQGCSSIIGSLKLAIHNDEQAGKLFAAHFRRGFSFERLGEIEKAISDYSACINMDSRCSEAFFNRASLRRVRGDFHGSSRDIDRAIKLDPSSTYYRSFRTMLLREKGNYMDAASESFVCRTLDLKRNPDAVQVVDTAAREDPIVEALSLAPEERTAKDLYPIIDFVRRLTFFSEFGQNTEVAGKIAKCCFLRSYEKGEVVFEEGTKGEEFYIIVRGKVKITKLRKMFDFDEITEQITLVTLTAGSSFGETAMETQAGLRTAGAEAVNPVNHLMVMHAQSYQDILQKYKAATKVAVKKALMSATSLFSHWSEDKIDALTSFAIVRNHRADTEIISAGKKVHSLMMIKTGIVKVSKRIMMFRSPHVSPESSVKSAAEQQLSDQVDLSSEDDYAKEDFTKLGLKVWVDSKLNNSFNDFMKISRSLSFTGPSHEEEDDFLDPELALSDHGDEDGSELSYPSTATGTSASMAGAEGGPEKKDFTVAVLLSGQVMGEMSVLRPDGLSPITAIASTALEVYCFERDVLLRLGVHEDPRIMKALRESFQDCDQSPQEIEFKFKSKYAWELKKARIIGEFHAK